jgi:hypothetical protein
MYVFLETSPGTYTVGFHAPGSVWHAESDFTTKEDAVARMRFLNGGPDPTKPGGAGGAPQPTAAPAKK